MRRMNIIYPDRKESTGYLNCVVGGDGSIFLSLSLSSHSLLSVSPHVLFSTSPCLKKFDPNQVVQSI